MDILSELYHKSASENEKNLRFWETYLQNLKSLDFSVFSHKLKVSTLVPIGNRILFRGELKHTNEVTVALGADYFVKCSVQQAEILRQHRMNDAQSKVDSYNKEKEYLENQMSFTKKSFYDSQEQEIIENYNEEDDKLWRQKHRENIRKHKQNKANEDKVQSKEISDEELWERLEELELQEELENELSQMNNDKPIFPKIKEYKEESFKVNEKEEETDEEEDNEVKHKARKVTFKIKPPAQTSKFHLLQQVIDKQNELEEKLLELKNRDRTQSKSETDLMTRLDEMEQLDELEDEMDRLDDIIENEDDEDDEEDSMKNKATSLQRRVSFVDEDDSETLEITFVHSPVEPKNDTYDATKGIQKPSDLYEAHSNLFNSGTTSILKKSKYESVPELPDELREKKTVQFGSEDNIEHQTIVVKDVVEKVGKGDHKIQSQARPTSLFKKKRMQNKS